MENKTRNNIIRVLHKKMGEAHELLDQIDNCDVADCDEPGYAWCEAHPDRRICSYHATSDAEGECYFCPECYAGFLADQVPDHYGEATEMVNKDQTKTPEIKPMESAFSDYQIGDTALVRIVVRSRICREDGALTGVNAGFCHDPDNLNTFCIRDIVPKSLIPRAEHERELAEARELWLETDIRTAEITARDAVTYLIKEYDHDTGHQDSAELRPYVHEYNGRCYNVIVQRQVPCPKCGPDIDPDGFDWNAGHDCTKLNDKPATAVAPKGCPHCKELGNKLQKAYDAEQKHQSYTYRLEQALDEAKYRAAVPPIKPGSYIAVEINQVDGENAHVTVTSGDQLWLNRHNVVYVPDTGKTAVAPKGVVARLLALGDCLKDAEKPWMSSITRAIANEITELPEPSECDYDWRPYFSNGAYCIVITPQMGGTIGVRPHQVPYFIAALIERAALLAKEGTSL